MKNQISSNPDQHVGYVALIGRTNVGKSTFLNAVMEVKVSIVSNKPQTTRKRILGIKTSDRGQIVFFDSPGIHQPRFRLNEKMMKDVHHSLKDADLILYFVDVQDRRDDPFILEMLAEVSKPVILVINKIDLIQRVKSLERIAFYQNLFPWKEIIPVSALREENIDRVEEMIYQYLPKGAPLFPEEEFTRQSEKFYVSELIREKVLTFTRQELPFTTTVQVLQIQKKPRIVSISAEIFVETRSQKKIVVGKKGDMVKKIGETARVELEEYFLQKVFLDLHIKVVPGWRNSPAVLNDIFE